MHKYPFVDVGNGILNALTKKGYMCEIDSPTFLIKCNMHPDYPDYFPKIKITLGSSVYTIDSKNLVEAVIIV